MRCSSARRVPDFAQCISHRHARVRPLTTTMASLAARTLPVARIPYSRVVSHRLLSTTRVVRQEATPNLGSVPPAKKPVGAFRGG